MWPTAGSVPPLLIGELLLDRRGVDPRALTGDEAVVEVEDVEDARAHRPPAALMSERPAVGEAVQDRLVDDVLVAVPAPDGLESVDSQVGEQPRVEAGDLLASVQRAAGPAGHVVLGVGGEASDDLRDVARRLRAEWASTRSSIAWRVISLP